MKIKDLIKTLTDVPMNYDVDISVKVNGQYRFATEFDIAQFSGNRVGLYGIEKPMGYDPQRQGAVTAIRIYLENGYWPMAELAFAFGGTKTISWSAPDEREKYAAGITANTYIYDERPKREFKDWVMPEQLV